MGAKEKRERERLEAVHKRKNEVKQAAKLVFAEKSIEKATMQDIADQAEVGVASVYRYYSTKNELVLEVARDYWDDWYLSIPEELNGTGIEQTSYIMKNLSQRFIEKPDMLIFMDQLETFLAHSEGSSTLYYHKIFDDQRSLFGTIIERGIEDGSIRKDIPLQDFGFTIMDLFFALAQKLAIREQAFITDGKINVLTILECYQEMIIQYLKAA